MDNKEINTTIKELFIQSKNNTNELSKLIDKYLIPQENEKKKNAEISTPYQLRQDMLDKIPKCFWNKPRTIFEPCCGKGGFLIDIVNRFMNGLENMIVDEEERYKTIVEKCLYFSDINPTNIYICKLLLDINKKYKLKYNEGNTLELNIKDKWNINGFDAVIGNPPYNSSGNVATGNTIWQHFTKKALNEWVKDKRILIFVHPPGWRKPNTPKSKFYGLYDLMVKENYMSYLEIHGIKDGQKVFKCGTRYDWYLIKKCKDNKETTIIDEEGQKHKVNLKNLEWLPNSNINNILKLLVNNKKQKRCPIIYNRNNYGTDKKWISKNKTKEYKYTIIHTIPKTDIRYLYSKVNDKGHFNISKVIFANNGFNDVIIDMNGKYGMSESSMAIKINTRKEGNNIKKALLSDEFKKIIKSCSWSNFVIDWRLFTSFRKDFWKEFI